MNHQKIYNNIIVKSKSENRKKIKNKKDLNYVYYEEHHILPKCLNGLDEDDNLVLLTAKEHFTCHKLLIYIYKGNRKIALAFHYMSYNKKWKNFVSLRDYVYIKELLAFIPVSKETREKLSKISKGKISPKRGIPISEEHKEKISKARLGKTLSEETKQKMRKPKSKKTIQKMKGRKLSEETKKKISEANKGNKNWLGKHHSEETKQKIKEKRKLQTSPGLGIKQTKEWIEKRVMKTKLKKLHSG